MLTKWQSYRDQGVCDVTSPYVYINLSENANDKFNRMQIVHISSACRSMSAT